MFRRMVLVGLLAAGLLAVGGLFGWSGGYDAGLAADGEVARYADGFPAFFFGLAVVFKVLFVLFLVMLIAKVAFFWRRGRRGHWKRWHDHDHGWHREGSGPEGDDDSGGTSMVA